MGCGCGNKAGVEEWTVYAADSTVHTFATKIEADVKVARVGGTIKRTK